MKKPDYEEKVALLNCVRVMSPTCDGTLGVIAPWSVRKKNGVNQFSSPNYGLDSEEEPSNLVGKRQKIGQ